MISQFRKIRQKLLSQNRATRYLAYAIGEIVLVTIGILIALQINTWNESRKEQKNLLKVYAQIRQDLQTDTLNVRLAIEDLQAKNLRLLEIVDRTIPEEYYDSINVENFKNCELCAHDITALTPFQNLDKGFQLLKTLNTGQNLEKDSLIHTITEFYSEYIPMLVESQDILTGFSKKTIEEYKQYDWFVDWSNYRTRPYNKEYVDYLFKSEKHRKDCAHYLIFSRFTLRVFTEYRDKSVEILQLIDENLA